MTDSKPTLAIIGGTGSLGGGLAFRWAFAGYKVIIGSRKAEKAIASASELTEIFPKADVSGTDNIEAARLADIVVLTVPNSHHISTLEDIKDVVWGKIVVDTTVPLVPPKVSRVQLTPDWPVAKAAQTLLGEDVRVVSAFHNVAAAHLREQHGDDESDVLVYGNNADARDQVMALVEATGLRGWHAGSIDNSVVSEALTSVLIFINKKYKIAGAGIRISGATE